MVKNNKANKVCSSDPSSFSIRLVNMNNYPNTNTLVAENVKADEGSYILDDFAGIDSGYVASNINPCVSSGYLLMLMYAAPASKSTSSTTTTRITVSWRNRVNSA